MKRVFEKQERKQVIIDEMRFMPGKDTIDAKLLLRQVKKKCKAAKIKLFECNMYKPNHVASNFIKSVNMAGDLIEKGDLSCYFKNVLCTKYRV